MDKYLKEIIITLLLVVILGALLLPTKLLMPMSMDTMLILGLILFFFIFIAFFWKEKAADEREQIHQMNAGRTSFFIGTGLLLVGIVLQSFRHNIDPWLIYALIGMLVGKLVSRIYSDIRH